MKLKKQNTPALVCSEIGLVRCLGVAGVPVFVGTEEDKSVALHSRYSKKMVKFSSYESDDFIQELCLLANEIEQKPVLMSYDDRLLLNISRNRDRLSNHYRFLLPDDNIVEGLLDKLNFVELAEEFKLPVPASVRVRNQSDLKIVEDRLDKPYLLKPLYRHHWFHKDFTKIVGSYKKAFLCSDREELDQLYGKIAEINPNVVVQEYIEGPDQNMYDINMYINSQGEIKGCIAAQKMRVYPPGAGYGSYVVTVKDQHIINLSKKIAKEMNLVGLINIQFKRDEKTGKLFLIEIHPRTSIFDILGIKAKMNLPSIYYSDMTGLPIKTNGHFTAGVKYLNMSRDLRLFLSERKSYGLTVRNMVKSYMGPKVIDGFSIKDPVPAVMEFWQKVRKIF